MKGKGTAKTGFVNRRSMQTNSINFRGTTVQIVTFCDERFGLADTKQRGQRGERAESWSSSLL
jgi:hypothetical protein